ncbi:MAG: chromosome segregation protein ScpA [Verrucomicrobia bacterium]|nr:chromosome segregation protein ScpA [Verrucomicrobiota bacterium]
MSDYKVKFEVFEGPLDLLLYLIRKEEVDIYEVNLTQLATQFIEYIEVMRMLDLEVAGEFLVMASTLMYIKSKELLPVEQRAEAPEEEEGEDPRWELIRQLVEYKKFKDAAAQLQAYEARMEEVYPRIPGVAKFEPDPSASRPQASLFDLLNAVNSILKRLAGTEDESKEIYEDTWTVSGKMELLLKEVAARPSIKFSELFASAAHRSEVVATFLAVLELIRLRQILAIQTEAFGEIQILQAPEPVLPAPLPNPEPQSVDAVPEGQPDVPPTDETVSRVE